MPVAPGENMQFIPAWRVQLNVASLATTATTAINNYTLKKLLRLVTETAVSSDGERIAAD